MDNTCITQHNLNNLIQSIYQEQERVPSFDNGKIPFFKANNYKSPELYPIITVVNKFFNYSNDNYCETIQPTLKSVRRYFDSDNYYLSFKIENCQDVYTVTINKELTCCSSFLRNNRKVSLSDYIELLNLLYLDINVINTLIKDHL